MQTPRLAFRRVVAPCLNGARAARWEDELFQCLPDQAVLALLAKAEELVGTELIDSQIRTLSNGALNVASCRIAVSPQSRTVLAQASKVRNNSWFKNVSRAEEIGRDVVALHLNQCEAGFVAIINGIWGWLHGVG